MLRCFHFQILERFLVGCRHGRSSRANHQSKQRNHEQREQAIHWPSFVPSLTCPLASANLTTAFAGADVRNCSRSLCKALGSGLLSALARTLALRTLLRIFPLGDLGISRTNPTARIFLYGATREKPRTPSTLPRGCSKAAVDSRSPGLQAAEYVTFGSACSET